MADFQRLARLSRITVEKVHGDAVTVIPVARGTDVNAPALAIDGQAYGTMACFFENTLVENDAYARPLTGQGRLQNAAPAIAASIRLVDDRMLEAGFLLRRISDGRDFEISSFKPDGLGTVLAVLNARKVRP
ncbi:hypothetical protein [Shinella zoogloeoides]|uniref:hypothetical protein n=1 Tax=Shinella zoogloeoides TaxID=352475 RepID=UPI0028AD31C3|nr:hypothetical protein [Shinella zoogloeoides]